MPKVMTDIPHNCGGVAEVETDMSQTPVEGDDCAEMGPPDDGRKYWILSGDAATCQKCGAVGRVEADGESAWVDWGEDLIPDPVATLARIAALEAENAVLRAQLAAPPVIDRIAMRDAIADALGSSAYDCARVWSAWSYGTMGQDDFRPVVDDEDRLMEIVDAVVDAIASRQPCRVGVKL